MSEDSSEQLAPVTVKESAGVRLARERASQDMSVADVARALRLSVKQVEALEADRLDGLPGRTFVRGFVRNYARLLNLNPDQFVAEYLPSQPEKGMQHIQAPSQQISFSEHERKPWLKWLASSFAVVALVSWGVLEWMGPEQQKSRTAAKPPVSMPQATVQPDAASITSPAVSPPSTSAASPASAAASAITASLPRFTLGFSGKSWVEVRDKQGKIIHSQNHEAGSEQIVEGDVPFTLVIGSAPNVKLTYKGQPVDLSAHTKADVARLTLE